MLTTENMNASPILRQNSAGGASQLTKTWRNVGEVGGGKEGKSLGARKPSRAAGDIRRVAKGHSTAIRTARNVIPAKAACNHLFHASRRCLKKTSRATSTARKGNVRTTASVPRTAR